MGEGDIRREELSLLEPVETLPITQEVPEPEIEPVDDVLGLEQTDTETSLGSLQRGDLIEGIVIEQGPEGVLVNLDGQSEGLIGLKEFENLSKDEQSELSEGDRVLVFVVKPQGPNGKAILSIEKAKQELDWKWAEELLETREAFETKISGFNKGGLLVQMRQLVGFTPGSQLDPNRQQSKRNASPGERWGHLVGCPIMIKVIEVDRQRNRLILSEKTALKEWRRISRDRLLENLKEGDILQGRVSNLVNFGAFVDLGGADGLIHLSELAWKQVTHPRQVVKVGEQIQVYVLNVDRERKRIGLSLKRLEQDPWFSIEETLPIGSLIDAKITNITNFGAFARPIDLEEIEGLIHISEISYERIGHPGEKLETGQTVTLRVIGIDPHRRRLALSLKQVISDEYLDSSWGDEFSSLQ
ncbi:MAG: S1 RNA-binding domain-containing protein [Anaerolineales bacterium]|nr:S1 RNA-binding domain-containing protein [Anaerolineales bacterium]